MRAVFLSLVWIVLAAHSAAYAQDPAPPPANGAGQNAGGGAAGTRGPEGTGRTPDGATPATTDASGADTKAAPAGQGAPEVVLAPTQTVADVALRVTLDQPWSKAVQGRRDPSTLFTAGPLVNSGNAATSIVPTMRARPDIVDGASVIPVDVHVSGLTPFGELSVPVLFDKRQVETIRFQKPGLIVKTPADGPIVAQQKAATMLLVLENPTGATYANVRARVRFQDVDECRTSSDQLADPPARGQPSPTPPPATGWFARTRERFGALKDWAAGWGYWAWIGFRRAPAEGQCRSDAGWTEFQVRPSSQVSLAVPLHEAWFEDVASGLTRTATRQGLLTLRYRPEPSRGAQEEQAADRAAPPAPDGQAADAAGNVTEQNVPIEVRFEARSQRLFLSILWIFVLLLTGALFFLILRVSIPNYRRKKALKGRLNEAWAATERISDQVDSQLRVLIRVERLALDQRRREGWVLLPGFEELAARVEAGLAILHRKIALVERLDAATWRRESLVLSAVAPTRLDIIDRNIDSACEALKNDQLSEADWLLIQNRLEAVEKALHEPSDDEKRAFESLLSQRWRSISGHFRALDSGELQVPPELDAFKACFPKASLLPAAKDDPDGTTWIASVGIVRADLQLTALELLRDLHFLSAALGQEKWADAVGRLTGWLATPAVATLPLARQYVRQLAEGVSPEEIVAALAEDRAHIDMDPQCVSPNQTVRLTVRFSDPRFDSLAARNLIRCAWSFHVPTVRQGADRAEKRGMGRWFRERMRPLLHVNEAVGITSAPLPVAHQDAGTANAPAAPAGPLQEETGWRVYRYFEPDVTQQRIDVRFYVEGRPVLAEVTDGTRRAVDVKSGPAPGAEVQPVTYSKVVVPQLFDTLGRDHSERWLRFAFQTLQMFAVLLVPLVTLAMTAATEPASGQWWDLVGLGFGSEAIRNILTTEQPPSTS